MAQIDRILASRGFFGSDPMRQMLLYLASKSIEHPGEGVKEFELATSALGKGDDYDPRTDSAVRVIASRLRAKLAEYYAQDGAHDPVVISVPKGAYLLASVCRSAEPPATSPTEALPSEPVAAKGTRRLFVGAGASGVLGLLAGFYAGRRSGLPVVPDACRVFWRQFVEDSAPIIVYSNPRFVKKLDSGLCLTDPTLAEGPINSLYTGVGEVMAVRQISKLLSALGKEPRVKRAQLFTWDDANSNDLIFVGGQQQNLPMSQMPRFEKFNLKPEAEEPYFIHGGVRNDLPSAGEQTFYMSSDDQDNGVEYGVIALSRGVVHEKHVLVVAGVRTLGTEAAAAAVCSPALLEELLRRLSVSGASAVPPFEALIELRVRGGAPMAPRLISVYKRVGDSNPK